MITSELEKEIRKPPVVEYQIPKRIFTKSEDHSPEEGNLLQKLWDFS